MSSLANEDCIPLPNAEEESAKSSIPTLEAEKEGSKSSIPKLEAEKEGSKSSNNANANLKFENHAKRDAKIFMGDKPGDREENIKDDHSSSIRITNDEVNGDGCGGVVHGNFTIEKKP